MNPGDTVTCVGTVNNQNNPDGYGTGAQSNITVNVQSGASVTGDNDGLHLNQTNTVNNYGTITGNTLNGVEANNSLTVNNFSGATITGLNAGVLVNNAGATATILNYGTISSNGLSAIASDSVTLTNYGRVDGADAGVQTGLLGGSATVTNYGIVTGANRGLDLNSAGTVYNYGTISGTNGTGVGVSLATGTVTNYGTISGDGLNGRGISIATSGTIINSGTISGTGAAGNAIFLTTNATASITNTGTIQGGGNAGIFGQGNTTATINNSGTISGFDGIFNGSTTGWTLTNSGIIIGTSGVAIDFQGATGDTLTFLPGSKVVGDIQLGTNDTVNIRTGPGVSTVFRFGYCGCGGLIGTGSTLNVSGTQPYVRNGDNVAVLDPTMLSQADKTLVFFTSNISSVLGSRFGQLGAMGTPGATAFAAAGASPVADSANAAFAGIPGLAYAGGTNLQDSIPAAMAYDRQTGTTVWSKAFVGTRHQNGDDTMLKTSTVTYGGAIGVDRPVSDTLLLGAYLGAGYGTMDVYLNSQSQKTDYAFGGTYGRFDWTWHFFDFAVSGGYLSNSSTRRVFNNAAPNGEESATASYNAFYVTPEIAYGWRVPLAGTATLTPVGRLRYVAGHFNGYTETGSFANLAVNGRTVQDLEERAELMLSFLDPLGRGAWLKTTATVGVLGLERVGGTGINTVLLGQNLSFSAAGKGFTAGLYGGLALDYRTAQAISVFAAIDATAMSDNSVAFTAKGGTRLSF